jgi:hypothetical protein
MQWRRHIRHHQQQHRGILLITSTQSLTERLNKTTAARISVQGGSGSARRDGDQGGAGRDLGEVDDVDLEERAVVTEEGGDGLHTLEGLSHRLARALAADDDVACCGAGEVVV